MSNAADEARAKAEAKKTLMARAKQLGLDVDKRWSVETLSEKLEEAYLDKEEADAQALIESADTWIFAIRDVFLGTDKHPAGSVVEVPAHLYQNWKATGACRLADNQEIAEANAA